MPALDRRSMDSSVTSPAARELTTTDEEPEAVVNMALLSTFSDSRENKMLLAAMLEEAFFIRRINLKGYPAMMVFGTVSKLSTTILALVLSFSLNSPLESSSFSLFLIRTQKVSSSFKSSPVAVSR